MVGEEPEISQSNMSGLSQTSIDTEMEIEEEFCAIYESIKSEDESKVDIKPATLPPKYVVQGTEARSESSALTQLSNNNVLLSLRCRLCAMPNKDMVDVFGSLETTKDILAKIEYSLPITVRDTDTLPKQICRCCLEELERCNRFRKTVAAANELLLAFEKLARIKSEETVNNNDYFLLDNAQLGSTEYDHVDRPLETNFDVETNDNESTNIPIAARTEICSRSCSVVLSILETCSVNNSGAENGEKSNTENRSTDSTEKVLDVERISSENHEESTCDSEANTENSDDFAQAGSRNELHKCETCARTFKSRSSLTRHGKIHQNQGLRAYTCKTCAKTFDLKSSLTRHGKIHQNQGLRPYTCKRCAKTFSRKSSLTRHSKIHTGKGLLSCQYCEKSFHQQSNLNRHLAVHSKGKNQITDSITHDYCCRERSTNCLTNCTNETRITSTQMSC